MRLQHAQVGVQPDQVAQVSVQEGIENETIATTASVRIIIQHAAFIAEDIVNHVDCPIWTFKNEE